MNKTFQSAQSCKFSIEKRLKTMDDRINSPGPGCKTINIIIFRIFCHKL